MYTLGKLVDIENDLFTINVSSSDSRFIVTSLNFENFITFDVNIEEAQKYGNSNYTIEVEIIEFFGLTQKVRTRTAFKVEFEIKGI